MLVGKLKNEEVLLRLNVKVGDVGSISKMRQTKKTIARIMTILNEKGVEDHG
ncbi:MAG: 50S ribosomal protein L29 [Deltaproteobacteria bacterium RIFCSPLOWO2_02_FULL_50_16]|nr:MAG: 50S ribosomal protein L29 [Deltaproteobacteria bacterium RIFCSPLOWO2_02_FULL_50_16]